MTNLKNPTMTYELTVTETNNKAGKYHYKVIDENGNVISERKSNREYVACTIDGGCYFGRIDLIGKGDYGRFLKYAIERMNMTEETFNNRYPKEIYKWTYSEMIEEAKNDYERLSKIAYKK